MIDYLLHSEIDSPTEKYIEVVFDIKKNMRKIALISFDIKTKNIIRHRVIKEIYLDDDVIIKHLKQKLTREQINKFTKYFN